MTLHIYPSSDYSPSFCIAAARILELEGGYSDDPEDPGHATKYGISQRSNPNVDLNELTRNGAVEIYHQSYWLPLQLDSLPSPSIATLVLNGAVLFGVYGATRAIQRGLNDITPKPQLKIDGIYGPLTKVTLISACQLHPILTWLAIASSFKLRAAFVAGDNPTSRKFRESWCSRFTASLENRVNLHIG